MNLSETIGDCLTAGPVTLTLDLFPVLDAGTLKEHLQQRLQSNQMLKNALAEDLPQQLVKGMLDELGIDGETPCHSVRSTDRVRLRGALADLPLSVKGLLGPDKAVASAGGVDLREIDFRTMESKLVPGLYIIGDLLDINHPSGGYSLQMCWTSGYVAGVEVAARL